MKIIKLNLKYFFCISNLVIIGILILFLFFSYFISIDNINSSLTYDEVLVFYYENSMYFTKIIMIILSCFIFIKSSSEKNNNILNIVITAGYTKKENYIYMIISNLVVLAIMTCILLVGFICIGYIKLHYFNINFKYINCFFNIFIIVSYYGLLTYFFQLLFNNQFVFIISIILYIISEHIVEIESQLKIIYLYFFPNINLQTGKLYVNIIFLLFLLLAVLIINLKIYTNQDLKN